MYLLFRGNVMLHWEYHSAHTNENNELLLVLQLTKKIW